MSSQVISAGTGAGRVRVGISGWRYAPWRGVFYPKGLKQRDELKYAAGQFGSIEINGTFYSLQSPEGFQDWAGDTPEDFVFAVKAPRYITHLLRLKGIETPLANFFANGLLALGPKLGPILWQFPAHFHFRPERIEAWLRQLPTDTEAAANLARHHDHKVAGRTFLEPGGSRPIRHAMEIRHTSFCVPEFVQLLRSYNVALVVADAVEWPLVMDVTSGFVYCRLHGSEELYSSGYDDRALDVWADRVAAWARGGEPAGASKVVDAPAPSSAPRDVFIYFDNDAKVRAPFDAKGLEERVRALFSGPDSHDSR